MFYRLLRFVILRIPLSAQKRLCADIFGGQVRKNNKTVALKNLFNIENDLDRFINKAAIEYDNGVHPKHRLTRYYDFFLRHIKENDYVLDIGCGNGFVAHQIAGNSGASVTGIDMNEESIRFAQHRWQHPQLTFLVGDALNALPDQHYDVIVLSNVLEHIEKRIDFLKNIQEKLSPAWLLLRVPLLDRDWRVPMKKELGMFPFSDPTHYTEYTQESFAAEMSESGLEIIESETIWSEIWAKCRYKIE